MKPYNKGYGFSVFLSILSVASGIGAYAMAGKIAKILFGENPAFESVIGFAVVVAVFKLLSVLLLNFSTWISHKAAYNTLKDIRKALSEKMLCILMEYFEGNGSGRLKTMMVDHVEGMEKTLPHMILELTANLLGSLCCIICMSFID